MNELIIPFGLPLTPEAFRSFKSFKYNLRRLSDLKEHYSDKSAVQQILANEDPTIYEFWEHEYDGVKRGLSFGMTCIYHGKVGKEYYQTRGHFHSQRVGDEMYMVVKGKGMLLLYSNEGLQEAIRLNPGSLYYLPGFMAHRTVNIGDEDLIFISIWPPQIDHDYDTIAQRGFPKLVVEGPDGAILVDNPAFIIEQT